MHSEVMVVLKVVFELAVIANSNKYKKRIVKIK